jgi:hypothetical protein
MKIILKFLVVVVAVQLVTHAVNASDADLFVPHPKVLLAARNQDQARVCQQQAQGCDSICKSSGADQKSCWAGCLDRYRECKMEADCQ